MMRKGICFLCAVLLAVFAGRAAVVRGVVADGLGRIVEYATVVALSGGRQAGGTVTDSVGRYELALPDGSYRLNFSAVGFTPEVRTVAVRGDVELNVRLAVSGVLMKEVEVKASAIRREPDRFVMSVEDLPSSIGQDGQELLRQAPGVWIDDEKISINGRSGTKVYIGDRELKFSEEQLLAFLKSLKAEDISKVEVIPQSGAEYSADTSAGIIRITMKRNRADGVMGSAGVIGSFGRDVAMVSPSGTLNVKSGKWTYSVNSNWNVAPKMLMLLDDGVRYANGSEYLADSRMDAGTMVFGNVTAGVFYDMDDRNSFGLELSYVNDRTPTRTMTDASFVRTDFTEQLVGDYRSASVDNNIDLTFNYIHKLDTIGSQLKLIANYSRQKGSQGMDNFRHTVVGGVAEDSVSRSDERSVYDVANFSLDWDKKFNDRWNFSAGAKYTLNRMDNRAFYEYREEDHWLPQTAMSYDENYRENIVGIYAKAGGRIGRVSAVVGLRGEYTGASSRGRMVEQSYFDWFPNANITYLFTEQGSYSLTASYGRSISRPSFWALNPIRKQASDYTYQTGNPDLKPSYGNNISLTAVFAYRYSLSAWVNITRNQMLQGAMSDPNDPDVALIGMINAETQSTYGATLSLPMQLTEWWDLTANATYMYMGDRMTADDPLRFSHIGIVMCNTGFRLPLDFYVSSGFMYQSKARFGNMELSALPILNFSVKKSFAQRRWTASFTLNNVLSKGFDISTSTGSFVNRTKQKSRIKFGLSLTYNFNVGKMFRKKEIESNADASRLEKDGNGGR